MTADQVSWISQTSGERFANDNGWFLAFSAVPLEVVSRDDFDADRFEEAVGDEQFLRLQLLSGLAVLHNCHRYRAGCV